jgi:hypothetical protein
MSSDGFRIPFERRHRRSQDLSRGLHRKCVTDITGIRRGHRLEVILEAQPEARFDILSYKIN